MRKSKYCFFIISIVLINSFYSQVKAQFINPFNSHPIDYDSIFKNDEGFRFDGLGNVISDWDSSINNRLFKSTEEIELYQINDHLYQTEHCLFIVDVDGRVDWPSWSSYAYSWENLDYFTSEFTSTFPGDFTTLTLLTTKMDPNYNMYYYQFKWKADGINWMNDMRDYDICMYNIGYAGECTGNTCQNLIIPGFLFGFDHEFGHAWGPLIDPMSSQYHSHWSEYSTIFGQMAVDYYIINGNFKRRKISGDPINGFKWEEINNTTYQNSAIYSDQQLYIMGLRPEFPVTYVLNDALFNADGTMGFSSFDKFDHQSTIDKFGQRIPNYIDSPKKHKIGFIYVVKNTDELMKVYIPAELGIKYFTYSYEIDVNDYRSVIPFLACTGLRSSVDSWLSDLDGNISPEFEINQNYQYLEIGESFNISYNVSDADGPQPTITCISHPSLAKSNASSLAIGPINTPGTYFFTFKAEDSGGKIVFDHVVVDVGVSYVSTENEIYSNQIRFKMEQNHPNPFNPSTTVSYTLPEESEVTISIYNLLGKQVAQLFSSVQYSGTHSIQWNGTDQQGNLVPAGIYFYQLRAGDFTQTKKMVLMK